MVIEVDNKHKFICLRYTKEGLCNEISCTFDSVSDLEKCSSIINFIFDSNRLNLDRYKKEEVKNENWGYFYLQNIRNKTSGRF